MDLLPYILIPVFLVFVGLQLFPLLKARRMRGQAAPDIGDLLPDAARHERVLLYFWSPSCMMCRAVTPVIDDLATRHPYVVKIDASARPEVARRFGVMGTPTLVLLRAGRVEQMLVGAKSEKQIRALIGA